MFLGMSAIISDKKNSLLRSLKNRLRSPVRSIQSLSRYSQSPIKSSRFPLSALQSPRSQARSPKRRLSPDGQYHRDSQYIKQERLTYSPHNQYRS